MIPRNLLVSLAAALALPVAAVHADDRDLHAAFTNPSNDARPWAWWFFIDGNISANGLRKDLAEMQDKGLGGVNIFNVAPGGPPGPVRYMTPQWLDMMRLATTDAQQRGFPVIVHEAAGWSGSGGPWVKVEDSMQVLVWTETRVDARDGAAVTAHLATPPATENHYHDIAVLAFPTPAAELEQFPGPKITRPTAEQAADGVTLEFPHSVKAATLKWSGKQSYTRWNVTVEAQNADGTWRQLATADIATLGRQPTVTTSFEPTEAKVWRVRQVNGQPMPPGELVLSAAPRLPDWELKAGFLRRWGHDGGARPNPPGSEGAAADAVAIDPQQIRDISGCMDASGTLNWTPPAAGAWTIIRLGNTCNGAKQNPAPKEGVGLEPDTMEPTGKGIAAVFEHSVDRLLSPEGAGMRGKLRAVESDSWEFATQNWTPQLRRLFQQRYGYDPLPWFVVSLGGRFVGSAAQSEAFLWDMRRLLADLLAENYYEKLAQAAHARGLQYYSEATGAQQYLYDFGFLRPADVPMGENWSYEVAARPDCKLAAAMGQLYDRKVVAAETFTGHSLWRETPAYLKTVADSGFVAGVNQVIIHNYTHQPYDGPTPGFSLGGWGINDNRFTTWWDQSRGFHDYLARCSSVLQQGTTVADILYLLPNDAPAGLSYDGTALRKEVPGVVPAGYDFTVCDVRALRERVTVKDGQLALPNGARFRVLVLPDRRDATLEALQMLAGLVRSGGVVVGPKPTHSPTRQDWPKQSDAVRRLADEVWGDCDGQRATEHAFGRGRVFWGRPLSDVLAALRVEPDLKWTGAASDAVDYIHRRAGADDAYFIYNRTAQPIVLEASFRGADATPEYCDPVSGQIRRAEIFRTEQYRTVLPLKLVANGSLFVVLRRAAPAAAHYAAIEGPAGALPDREITTAGRYTLRRVDGTPREIDVAAPPAARPVEGAWRVSFKAPGREPFSTTFAALQSWADSADPRVKYFSGTATYQKTVDVPADWLAHADRVYLELGDVKELAGVTVNGRAFGVCWTAPYAVDVRDALRPGANRIEFQVTNTWINRLIGDEQLPPDVDYKPNGALLAVPAWLAEGRSRPTERQTFSYWRLYKKDSPLVPAGLLGPVVLRPVGLLPAP